MVATGATRFEHQLPDEWRLDELLRTGTATGALKWCLATPTILTQRDDLATHFKGKKQYLMESFYRMMRKRTPCCSTAPDSQKGKVELRRQQPEEAAQGHVPPQPKLWPRDVAELIAQLEEAGVQTWAVWTDAFGWPVTGRRVWSCWGCLWTSCSRCLATFRTPFGGQLDRVPQPIELRHECQNSASA